MNPGIRVTKGTRRIRAPEKRKFANNVRLTHRTRKALRNVRNAIKAGETVNSKIANFIRRVVREELANTRQVNIVAFAQGSERD